MHEKNYFMLFLMIESYKLKLIRIEKLQLMNFSKKLMINFCKYKICCIFVSSK